jgi:deazaflavin-dependent oxidoreductase (nitroreductase family)
MHIPRDPGEWLVMAALMGVLMIGIHRLRSHLTVSGGHTGVMSSGLVMRIGTAVVGLLLRLGIPVAILGPMMLLTVRGRRSGDLHTLPVDVHDVGGRRFLIATHGVGAWVLNLRAAGEGWLRLGRQRLTFTARELPPAEAAPIMRAALGTLVASSGWRGRGVRANLGVPPGADESDYAAAAATHPVFEVLDTATRLPTATR